MLRRLSRGLERREALPGGAAREGLDAQLLELVGSLRSRVQPTLVGDVMNAPPRPIALALAQALYSQPLLGAMFSDLTAESTEEIALPAQQKSDRPIVFPVDLLRDVLHLQDWELDELREDIDRRVGLVLKQGRALQWLWDHFNLPQSNPEHLFHVLFPAAGVGVSDVGMIRYGAQLYAVVDQSPPPPTSSLFISWIDCDQQNNFSPLGTFGGKYVDQNLRRSMARAIGSDDDEIVRLLDAMVTVIPRRGAAEFVHHDLWRIRGLAMVSGLGAPYTRASWLTRTLLPDEMPFEDWLKVKDGKLVVENHLVAWDGMATMRVTEMMRQLHAELLARLNTEGVNSPTAAKLDDLSLYHLRSHLRYVLNPLINWASSADTAHHISQQLDFDDHAVSEALQQVATDWRERSERYWLGEGDEAQPSSVRSALTQHVLCVHDTLRKAHRVRDPLQRYAHADLLLLFASHYFANLDLVRRLALGDLAAANDDPVASWFMGTWRRLLARSDPETSTFSGSMHIPDELPEPPAEDDEEEEVGDEPTAKTEGLDKPG